MKFMSSRSDDTESFVADMIKDLDMVLYGDFEFSGKRDFDYLKVAVTHLARRFIEEQTSCQILQQELIAAKNMVTIARADLKRATNIIVELTNPVTDEHLLTKAVSVLRRDGEAILNMSPRQQEDSIALDTNLTFDETLLPEGLRSAINEYNNSLLEKIVS